MKTKFLQAAYKFLNVHSSSLLTAAGIVGFASTIPIAIRCKKKADMLYIQLQTSKAASGLSPVLTKGEKVKIFFQSYWVVGVVFMASAGCVILSDVKMYGKNNALKAGMMALQGEVGTLKDSLKEHLSEKEANDIITKADQQRVKEIYDDVKKRNDVVEESGFGNQLCCDLWSGRFFRSDAESIRRAFNDLNEQRLSDSCFAASVNDLYYYLGLEPNEIGGEFGWDNTFGEALNGNATSNILPNFVSGLLDDGTTYLGFKPSIPPEIIN